MPRKVKEYKYHFVYKTTNIKNGKFYIGIHSTDDLNDGYLGSGKRLRNSIRKHGKKVHIREILEFSKDRNSLVLKEEAIVNAELLKDPLCMNLSIGGRGIRDLSNVYSTKGMFCAKDNRGHLYFITNEDLRYQSGELVGNTKDTITVKDCKGVTYQINKNDPRYLSGELKSNLIGEFDWNGKKHKEESKKKMSDSAKNRMKINNHSKGTIWISNGQINKMVKPEDLGYFLNDGWNKGRYNG